jgi:hypothetical protein
VGKLDSGNISPDTSSLPIFPFVEARGIVYCNDWLPRVY